MSDNSIPTPPDAQPTPPPAAPTATPPPAQSHQAAPHAPQPPSYQSPASAQPTQAYPGAAPSFAPQQQAYGGAPQQSYGGAPQQPHGGAPQQPQYGAVQPYGAAAQQPYGASAQANYGAPGQPVGGYSAYGAPVYPAPRPASGLAITSLICGIAGIVLFWAVLPILASVVAVITGHLALRKTKDDPSVGGRGMAFAGLIMGYVMVGVLVIGLVMTLISFIFFGAFTLPFLFAS